MYKSAMDDLISDLAGTYGPDDKLAIYVRFEGVLSPPASAESGKGYGHLGLYAREVKVTEALEARYYLLPYSPCDH